MYCPLSANCEHVSRFVAFDRWECSQVQELQEQLAALHNVTQHVAIIAKDHPAVTVTLCGVALRVAGVAVGLFAGGEPDAKRPKAPAEGELADEDNN